MPKARSKSFYDTLANTAKQHAMNRFPNARFISVGSRNRGEYTRESDYDYRVEISNMSKLDFNSELIEYLQEKLTTHKEERIVIGPGTNDNVVNIKPVDGGKVSFYLKD
jgi:predicted nucleotidyltransferase